MHPWWAYETYQAILIITNFLKLSQMAYLMWLLIMKADILHLNQIQYPISVWMDFCGWNCAQRKPTIRFPLVKPNPDRLNPTAFDWSSRRVHERYEIVWTRTAKPVFKPDQTLKSCFISHQPLTRSLTFKRAACGWCSGWWWLTLSTSTFSMAEESSSF